MSGCGHQPIVKAPRGRQRLHKHFSEPEIVEIGSFVAITMGQQRWLRILNIEHHQVLPGTDPSSENQTAFPGRRAA
jgi:hypothetical protein